MKDRQMAEWLGKGYIIKIQDNRYYYKKAHLLFKLATIQCIAP
jgi:hypothetical protein